MPSKSRKAAIRQSNIRKRKKVTKPNVKNFDLENSNNINKTDEITQEDSEYNNASKQTIDIPKETISKGSTVTVNNNLFFELKRITLISVIIAILLGILTVSIP